jgi:tripeptide aminopeptidase
MADRDRMVKEFLELASIDSISREEREMADALKQKLLQMGLKPYEDNAGELIGGNAGNVICLLEGQKDIPAVLVMAHMDTVVPGKGKKPMVEGNIIKSDGTTVLGSDDVAGIVCILEAVRTLKEENLKHGDIYMVFTVAEEIGLLGSKNLDYTRLNARYGFVLDGDGPIGTAAVKAPSHNSITAVIKGKAAHAGMAPEKGIDAIRIASEAISNMKLGRIDHETTANVGKIRGGQAVNIVCDTVEIEAETRSRDEGKLEEQTNHMRDCLEKAARKYGGTVQFKSEREYPAYSIDENDEIMSILRKAADDAGVKLRLEATGGGSDTNIINGKGIKAVDLSIGMENVHSVEERIDIDNMVKAAEFLTAILKNVK